MSKLTIKRIIPLYSVITEKFKKDFELDSLEEIKTLDKQINMIQVQIKQLQSRFGLLANQSTKNAQEHINNTIMELSARIEQINMLKVNMLQSLQDIKNKPLGEKIESGMFENYVEIKEGDNLLDILDRPKIIVKDNIIQEIVE